MDYKEEDAALAKLNKRLKSYIEAYRALTCLESNPNVDITEMSIRLHQQHKYLLETFIDTLHLFGEWWMEESEVIFTINFAIKTNGEFKRDGWDLYYWYDNGDPFNGDEYCNLTCDSFFDIGFRRVLFFEWDEYSDSGYRGKEPNIEDYKDPELEEHVRSLGLIPEYIKRGTYHSREILLLGTRPGFK